MKIIAILVLMFGVVLAGGAIYFASNYFDEFERRMAAQAPEGPNMVNVIVAKKTLPYGTVIVGNEHLTWAQWPESSLPPGVFTDAEVLLGKAEVDPKRRQRTVIRTIEAGFPILEANITGFGERGRMAMQLAEGMRAFSIQIDAISGVGGFINPGDRVDILLITGGRNNLESRVILQNVEVIAVDHDTNTEANRPKVARTATVQVTPKEAQKLGLAQNLGRLSLTLRALENQTAETEEPAETIDVRDLLGVEEAAPKKERAGTSITVRKAGEVTERLRFEIDN